MAIEAAEGESISLIGVDYVRLKIEDGGELYLTGFGAPFREHLSPQNWYAPDWFGEHRLRLEGTSTIYKVATRPVRGVSLDLVVRFSRIAEDVPLDAATLNRNFEAEFNSPFEEFALVMELRATSMGKPRARILTKKPLAIYVPAERLQAWQTGRRESKLAAKLARHPEVKLEMLQQYILLYGWIKGFNAVQAMRALRMSPEAGERFLAETTVRAVEDLQLCGFRMLDIKPQHVVLRICHDGSLLRVRNGEPAYALVDYELLERAGEN